MKSFSLHYIFVLTLACGYTITFAIPSADGKLLATFSQSHPPSFNVTVIDPGSAKPGSVVYSNSSLSQSAVYATAWNPENRILYLPVVEVDAVGAHYRIIGLQIDDNLSKATLVANWNMEPLTTITAMHFDSVTNSLLLIGLIAAEPFLVYTLDIATGKLTIQKSWGPFIPDMDKPYTTGSAAVFEIESGFLGMPVFSDNERVHYFAWTDLDEFNTVLYKHKESVPQAMFYDPSSAGIKAVFSDLESLELSFGTVSEKYALKQPWDVKQFVKVVSGLAPLDSGDQVFYTLLADSNGENLALVTADSNTGVIKQLVEWPQGLSWPSSLLFV